jgi:hypothetical protein
MHCGDQYPDKPPIIQFETEVNLPCVNPRNGMVSYTEHTGDFSGFASKYALSATSLDREMADNRLG